MGNGLLDYEGKKNYGYGYITSLLGNIHLLWRERGAAERGE